MTSKILLGKSRIVKKKRIYKKRKLNGEDCFDHLKMLKPGIPVYSLHVTAFSQQDFFFQAFTDDRKDEDKEVLMNLTLS